MEGDDHPKHANDADATEARMRDTFRPIGPLMAALVARLRAVEGAEAERVIRRLYVAADDHQARTPPAAAPHPRD